MPKAESAFDRAHEALRHRRSAGASSTRDEGSGTASTRCAETAENVAQRAPDQPRRPGRLRLSQQQPLRGAETRLLRRRDHAGHRAEEGQDRDRRRQDEHPRATPPWRRWPSSRPSFRDGGTVTAGNASGINDGACALLVAAEAAAQGYGLTPRARIVGMAVGRRGAARHGHRPGAGHAQGCCAARPRRSRDIDVIELNEAFAAQGLAVLRQLGLPDDDARVNPNGGAIALGHPLGASGAPADHTALNQLRHRRPLRAVHHVHRRRPGHRAGDRAGLILSSPPRHTGEGREGERAAEAIFGILDLKWEKARLGPSPPPTSPVLRLGYLHTSLPRVIRLQFPRVFLDFPSAPRL